MAQIVQQSSKGLVQSAKLPHTSTSIMSLFPPPNSPEDNIAQEMASSKPVSRSRASLTPNLQQKTRKRFAKPLSLDSTSSHNSLSGYRLHRGQLSRNAIAEIPRSSSGYSSLHDPMEIAGLYLHNNETPSPTAGELRTPSSKGSPEAMYVTSSLKEATHESLLTRTETRRNLENRIDWMMRFLIG